MTVHALFEAVAQGAEVPVRKRAGDAGYDLHALYGAHVPPGAVVKVRTGVRFNVPPGYVALINERSGHGAAGVFTLANVIDSGYRGEVHVVLCNLGSEPFVIRAGDRVAQAVVVPCLMLGPEGAPRGDAGFGSTGVTA